MHTVILTNLFIGYGKNRVCHRRLVHATEMGQRSICCQIDAAFLHVLITISGTSMCTCAQTTVPRILHSTASFYKHSFQQNNALFSISRQNHDIDGLCVYNQTSKSYITMYTSQLQLSTHGTLQLCICTQLYNYIRIYRYVA